MSEKKSAWLKSGYSLICIVLGLALLAPNFALSDDEDDADEAQSFSASAPANRSSQCDLSGFRLNTNEYFALSEEPAAVSFLNETGVAIYRLKKSVVFAGTGFSYNLNQVKREEETRRFTLRTINVLKAYPKDFILKMNSACFVLIDSISGGGAIAITQGGAVTIPTNANNTTINHELMHAVDYLYPFSVAESAAWIKANGAYTYDPNSNSSSAFSAFRYSYLSEAFITNYSKVNVIEDRAELVSAMGYNYSELLDKIKDKPVLKQKINLLNEKLKSVDASMTENYWKNRPIDSRDGGYEACVRRGNSASDCAANDVSLPQHSSWN